jgi:hypothetical protein
VGFLYIYSFFNKIKYNFFMKQNSLVEQRKYGFLSIIALVVGSVIGSGIFFKNDSVNATTQSGFISLVG